jgi:hypothetical protein
MTKRNDLGARLCVGPSVGQRFARFVGRVAGGVLLAAAMVTPIALVAPAEAQTVSIRVYDSNYRDYHNWDDREDRAYRRYVAERRWKYREYQRQSHRRQRDYWRWRHSHRD